MGNNKQDYLGRSTVKGKPQKGLKFNLSEQALSKVAAKAREEVTPDLNDLQNQIDSIQIHGMTVSNEFGDDPHIGISQKKLTESRDSLQNQINAIIAGQTQVNLSANKNAVFVGSQSTVSLSATANTQASSIKIFKNGVVAPITTGSGTSLSYADTVTPLTRSYIQYYSEFVVSGITKRYPTSGYINIQAVNPVYLGVDTTYSGASMSEETTPHAAGSFTRQLSTAAGNYLFIEVPDNFNLTAISLISTYETNLGFTQIESTRAGYKAYKNNEPRGAGIYTYKFTIANA